MQFKLIKQKHRNDPVPSGRFASPRLRSNNSITKTYFLSNVDGAERTRTPYPKIPFAPEARPHTYGVSAPPIEIVPVPAEKVSVPDQLPIYQSTNLPMTKIRLLHFADLHIGVENYGRLDPVTGVNGRVLDFLRRFDELIDYGLEREVDLVVFAGDAYKRRSPNPTYQRAFARRVKRLADAGVPVLLLVGNHDLPAMVQKASSVDIFRTLEVPNVVVGRDERVHRIETRRGPVQVATVPYPARQRLLAHDEYRSLSIEQLDETLRRIVTGNIQALAKQLHPDIPAVLTAHLSISGATYGSERSVMIGRDAVVLKSALANPAWDYVCFVPSQVILMADGGVKRIDQVLIGDQIMNHTGSADRVTQVTSRQYKGLLYSISTYYLPSPTLQVTPDHPILAVRREELLCPIPSRTARGLVCTQSTSRLSYPCNVCAISDMPRQLYPEYIRASELRTGDLLCVPIPEQTDDVATINLTEFTKEIKTECLDGRLRIIAKGSGWDKSVPSNIPLGKDFARLCGYFLAEGSLMTSKRHTVAGIQFTFGSHESDYQQDVINLAHRIFGKNCTVVPNKYGRSVTICVSSRIIGEMFRHLFRSSDTGCKATRLPDFMTKLPPSLESQILVGAIRGDGCLKKYDRNRRRGLITYATISETLAWQFWRLMLRQGLHPSLRQSSRTGPKNPTPLFTLDLYGSDVYGFDAKVFGRTLDSPQKTKRLCFRDDNFLYVPVRSIKVNEYTGRVLNIEVENAHTYVAGGVAVHNCLGHIHKHQELNDGAYPPMVYAGSLERIDFGEEGQPKGFCWVELARGETTWEFVQVDARRFVTIRADVREAASPLMALQQAIAHHDLREAVVRLILRLRADQEPLVRDREVRALLSDAYFVATIVREVEREARVRLGSLAPEEMTDRELLARYLEAKDTAPERARVLLEYADAIFAGRAEP